MTDAVTDEMIHQEAVERMKTLHAQLTAARESALVCSALLSLNDSNRADWLRDEVACALEVMDRQVRGNVHSLQNER
jgi:hypothetical protein